MCFPAPLSFVRNTNLISSYMTQSHIYGHVVCLPNTPHLFRPRCLLCGTRISSFLAIWRHAVAWRVRHLQQAVPYDRVFHVARVSVYCTRQPNCLTVCALSNLLYYRPTVGTSQWKLRMDRGRSSRKLTAVERIITLFSAGFTSCVFWSVFVYNSCVSDCWGRTEQLWCRIGSKGTLVWCPSAALHSRAN